MLFIFLLIMNSWYRMFIIRNAKLKVSYITWIDFLICCYEFSIWTLIVNEFLNSHKKILWVTVFSTHVTRCAIVLSPLKGKHFEWGWRGWSKTTNTSQDDATPGVGKAPQQTTTSKSSINHYVVMLWVQTMGKLGNQRTWEGNSTKPTSHLNFLTW